MHTTFTTTVVVNMPPPELWALVPEHIKREVEERARWGCGSLMLDQLQHEAHHYPDASIVTDITVQINPYMHEDGAMGCIFLPNDPNQPSADIAYGISVEASTSVDGHLPFTIYRDPVTGLLAWYA